MSFWITLILAILLAYLYYKKYISGKTLIIFVLLYIILFILMSIGLGFAGLFKAVCMNDKCTVVKLPLDIRKIRQVDAKNYLYSVIPLNKMVIY